MPELTIDLPWQAIELLQQLTRWGIYGRTPEEIAGRFVDRHLCDMAERKLLRLVPKSNGVEQQNGAHAAGSRIADPDWLQADRRKSR